MFLFSCYRAHLDLHSFPTRRSSDLSPHAPAPPGLPTGTATIEDNGTPIGTATVDRKSTRLNSSHTVISYAVFCLKKKKIASHPDRSEPDVLEHITSTSRMPYSVTAG